MRTERRGFRRRRLALTPLIDVIFLLLLFFMLSSSFARYGEVELTPGGAGPVRAGVPPVFLRLTAEGFSVNGRTVSPDAVEAAIDPFRAGSPQPLLLGLARGVTAQDLVAALVRLRSVPDATLVVVR